VQELAKWVVALSTLVGFGLTMGFNPALYGATADMLARNKQVAARMGWMFQTFNPTAIVAVVQGDVDRALLSRAVDIIVGSVFVIAAAVLAAWALRVPTRPSRPQRVHAPDAPSITYFPLGLSCAIVGFTTLPIMYMTGRITTGLTGDIALRLAAYAVFLLALVGPFLALAWLWSRFPGVSGRVSSLYARAMHTDFRWASAAILVAGGLVFIGLGVFAGH
jgi:hypothetical protein